MNLVVPSPCETEPYKYTIFHGIKKKSVLACFDFRDIAVCLAVFRLKLRNISKDF